MPRGPGGGVTLPPGNPVVPGTVIESDWANPTMEDVRLMLEDSLSRQGFGGMISPLRLANGTQGAPSLSFTNETTTGRFREGPGQVTEVVDGNRVMKYDAGGVYQWEGDQNTGQWVPLTPRDAAGTPFDPGPSNLISTNVQAAIEEVNDKVGGGAIPADAVTYDNTGTIWTTSNVQAVLGEASTRISGLSQDVVDLEDDVALISIDLGLLDDRVQVVETRSLNNETNIGLHETRLDNHDIDITNNRNDIGAIQLEQIQQNSDIATNAQDIDNIEDYVAGVGGLNDRITSNENWIIAHDPVIDSNTNRIGDAENWQVTYEPYIVGNFNDINAAGIGLKDRMDAAEADISDLQTEVIPPSRGGTGGNGLITGSGANVLQVGATLASPTIDAPTFSNTTFDSIAITNSNFGAGNITNTQLDGFCRGVTASATDNDTSLATTAWVHAWAAVNSVGEVQTGSSASGRWWWVRPNDQTPSLVVMAGRYGGSSSTTVTINFPATFPGGTPDSVLVCDDIPSGSGGVDRFNAVISVTSSTFTVSVHRPFYWIAVGE